MATRPSTTTIPAVTSTRARRRRSTSASPASGPPGTTDETLSQLLTRFPHVIAYVAGHTHENRIQPFTRSGGGVWWGIETSATADWPVQHRTIEVMDNLDGTLSIFGTVLDAASDSQAPAPDSAQAFNEEMLASIGREFAYNDPQAGLGSGEGTAADQNVELLVEDPRTANLEIVKTDSPGSGPTRRRRSPTRSRSRTTGPRVPRR